MFKSTHAINIKITQLRESFKLTKPSGFILKSKFLIF